MGQVLAAKAAVAAADTGALEQQLDALVAGRYGLSAAEVALLGGQVGGGPIVALHYKAGRWSKTGWSGEGF